MTFRTTPEDERRAEAEREQRERGHEATVGHAAGDEWGAGPFEATDAGRLRRPVRRGELRRLGGDGTREERTERLLGLALSGYSLEQLWGMRRELAARLAELPLGCEQSQLAGALSRAVRGELTRRALARPDHGA